MTENERYLSNLSFLGGQLCLDFANSVAWRTSTHPEDFLSNYSDLVTWSQNAGILNERKALRLTQKAHYHPMDASIVFEQAFILREAIYQVFSAVAANQPVDLTALETLNLELLKALTHLHIVPIANGFAWDWIDSEDALDAMLWTIANSAAELLTSQQMNRVRECSGDGCGWLFLDETRNGSRRWCDMSICGNRAKANRHYQRQIHH